MVEVTATWIPDVKTISVKRFKDPRGYFSELYSKRSLAEAGINVDFVQDNHSLSRAAGTIRGLHFQSNPHAQAKLVVITRGGVMDVAVDIRRNSPTFGQYVSIELTEESGLQLFIPAGFAHGFCTLSPDTEVIYKTSAFYAPNNDHGIAFDDPDLNIAWPVPASEATLSEKDRNHPKLADLPQFF
jgi:dTDP-4-dehydrorhamnose 3,5-epimerase